MNNIQIKKRTQSGFSLIEVMVTMAIIGILTAIAIPSYLSWKPGYKLRDSVSQVRGDLNRAKMRAIETRKQCQIVFPADGSGTYQINDGNRMMNSNDWGSLDKAGKLVSGVPFRNRTLTSSPQGTIGNAVTVTFSPRGTATNKTINTVYPGTKGATITITIPGRIKTTWL
jgi:prepilin-type N-terminal cleavage/methylation domain-containing protein